MIRIKALGLLLAATSFAVAPAYAQLSSEGGPIRISSDNSEVRELDRKVTFTGNVDIVQGDARLVTNALTINYAGDGNGSGAGGLGGSFGSIDNMVATGNVFYITPELQARGDEGIYHEVAKTITLTGQVLLRRGEDVARGCKLVMHLETNHSVLDGCEARTVMIINPESQE